MLQIRVALASPGSTLGWLVPPGAMAHCCLHPTGAFAAPSPLFWHQDELTPLQELLFSTSQKKTQTTQPSAMQGEFGAVISAEEGVSHGGRL